MQQVPAGLTIASQEEVQPGWIVRFRVPIFLVVALFYVIGFNGRWRVGRDSALYRGLAHSLATGHGYVFYGEPHDLALPGLPLILAGINRICGENVFHPVVPILFITAMACMVLVMVYRLIRLYFPPWIAILTTAALGVNRQFVEHANEIMTDMPFLLGLCAALLGYERLRRAPSIAGRILWAAIMTGGLTCAAIMRPTFWALALAWFFTCCWNLIVGRQRWVHAVALGALGLLVVAWFAADPRTSHFDPSAGGYEQHVVEKVKNMLFKPAVADKSDPDDGSSRKKESQPSKMLRKQLPQGFFGIELWYFSIPVSLLSLGYAIALARKSLMWGMLVAFSGIMFAAFGSAPRYFLMIMPLLLLGWVDINSILADHLRLWLRAAPARTGTTSRGHGILDRGQRILERLRLWLRAVPALPRVFLLLAVGLVVAPNMVTSLAFAMEQHALVFERKRPAIEGGSRLVSSIPIVRADFMQVYREGKFLPILQMSDIIRRTARESETVLGPEPTIMSYLSGRRVYSVTQLANHTVKLDEVIEKVKRRKVQWAVFPAVADTLFPTPDKLRAGERVTFRPTEDVKTFFDKRTRDFLGASVQIPPATPVGQCLGVMRLDQFRLRPVQKPPAPPTRPAPRPPATAPSPNATLFNDLQPSLHVASPMLRRSELRLQLAVRWLRLVSARSHVGAFFASRLRASRCEYQ